MDPVDHLRRAVEELVRAGTIHERLGRSLKRLSWLAVTDVPADFRASFEFIAHATTAGTPIAEEGVIDASLRSMSPVEAEEVALKICELFQAIEPTPAATES
mgnify:CR=1 FL=1